jgi:hypothetical protein
MGVKWNHELTRSRATSTPLAVPVPRRVLTLTACIKTAEEKRAARKIKISCSTRSGIRL